MSWLSHTDNVFLCHFICSSLVFCCPYHPSVCSCQVFAIPNRFAVTLVICFAIHIIFPDTTTIQWYTPGSFAILLPFTIGFSYCFSSLVHFATTYINESSSILFELDQTITKMVNKCIARADKNT